MSTDEKLGVEVLPLALPDRPPLEPPDVALPPEAALPPEDDVPDEPLDMPDEPPEVLPDAAGDDEDLSLLPVLLDEELCASATLDSANSAAAVAALNTLRLNIS